MFRFGLRPLLAVLVFGIVIPFAIHKLGQAIGVRALIAVALAGGLAYGAIKADNAWSGAGLADNLLLMATSAAVLAAYVGLSVAAAWAIARIRI